MKEQKIKLGSPPDPTRVDVSEIFPPDQSIYANPVTMNQESIARTPSTSQVGQLPNTLMKKNV